MIILISRMNSLINYCNGSFGMSYFKLEYPSKIKLVYSKLRYDGSNNNKYVESIILISMYAISRMTVLSQIRISFQNQISIF